MSSGREIIMIPSHFLHSAGCFSFFDPTSGVLFSSDIGAAVFPPEGQYLFVDDFSSHVKLIEKFHRRYMCSNKVIRKWLSSIENYDIRMIAPQHGAVYRKESVKDFIQWLRTLECGIDIIDSIYGR